MQGQWSSPIRNKNMHSAELVMYCYLGNQNKIPHGENIKWQCLFRTWGNLPATSLKTTVQQGGAGSMVVTIYLLLSIRHLYLHFNNFSITPLLTLTKVINRWTTFDFTCVLILLCVTHEQSSEKLEQDKTETSSQK